MKRLLTLGAALALAVTVAIASPVSLAGWPHFNHNADPDRMVLTVHITDHDGQ